MLTLSLHIGHRRSDLTSRPLRFLRVRDYSLAHAPEERPLWVVAVIHGRRNGRDLRKVIELPADLDALDPSERATVEAFVKVAKKMGADKSYIARQRKAWWAVGLREPAPILAS